MSNKRSSFFTFFLLVSLALLGIVAFSEKAQTRIVRQVLGSLATIESIHVRSDEIVIKGLHYKDAKGHDLKIEHLRLDYSLWSWVSSPTFLRYRLREGGTDYKRHELRLPQLKKLHIKGAHLNLSPSNPYAKPLKSTPGKGLAKEPAGGASLDDVTDDDATASKDGSDGSSTAGNAAMLTQLDPAALSKKLPQELRQALSELHRILLDLSHLNPEIENFSMESLRVEGDISIDAGRRLALSMDGGPLSKDAEGKLSLNIALDESGLETLRTKMEIFIHSAKLRASHPQLTDTISKKGFVDMAFRFESETPPFAILNQFGGLLLSDYASEEIKTLLLLSHKGADQRQQLIAKVEKRIRLAHQIESFVDLDIDTQKMPELHSQYTLPTIRLKGKGHCAWDLTQLRAESDLTLEAQMEGLSRFDERIPSSLDKLSLNHRGRNRLQLGMSAPSASDPKGVSTLSLSISEWSTQIESGGLRLGIANEQPIELYHDGMEGISLKSEGPLLDLSSESMPLELLNPFLTSDLSLGGTLLGSVQAEYIQNQLSFKSEKGLALKDLSLRQKDQLMFENWQLNVPVKMELDAPFGMASDTSIELTGMTLRNAKDQEMLTLKASMNREKGRWDLETQATLNGSPLLRSPFARELSMDAQILQPVLKLALKTSLEDSILHLHSGKLALFLQDQQALSVQIAEPFNLYLDGPHPYTLHEGKLLSLRLEQMNLDWVSAFVPQVLGPGGLVSPKVSVSGTLQALDVYLFGASQQMRLEFQNPMLLSQFSLYDAQRAEIIRDVDIAFMPQLMLGGREQSIDIVMLRLSNVGQAPFWEMNGRARRQGGFMEASAAMNLALEGLQSQESVRKALSPTLQGMIQSELQLKHDASGITSAGQLQIKSFADQTNQLYLPMANLAYNLKQEANSVYQLEAPASLLTPNGLSDLMLKARLDPEQHRVDAKVNSDTLVVMDLVTIAQVFQHLGEKMSQSDPKKPRSTPEKKATKESTVLSQALWVPYTGSLDVSIKTAPLKGQKVEDFVLRSSLTPDSASLDALSFRFCEGIFESKGQLVFVAEQTPRYALSHELEFSNLDSALAIFGLTGKAPPIEGVFRGEGRIESEAADLAQLPYRATGKLLIEGGPGLISGLGPGDERQASKADIGSLALGLLGGVTQNDGLTAFSRIIQETKTIPYDRIQVFIKREDPNGANLDIESIRLDGPKLGVDATGFVRMDPNRPPMHQAFEATLNIGAKGALGQSLYEIGLLDNATDDQGYQWAREPFKVYGTLSNPNLSEIWERVRSIAVNSVFDEPDPQPQRPKVAPLQQVFNLFGR